MSSGWFVSGVWTGESWTGSPVAPGEEVRESRILARAPDTDADWGTGSSLVLTRTRDQYHHQYVPPQTDDGCHVNTKSVSSVTMLLQVLLLCIVSSQARFQAEKNVPSRNMNKLLLNTVSKTSNQHLKAVEYVTKPDSGRLCLSDRLYLFVLIHSQPGNFKERELVRKTWGSVAKQKRDTEVKLLFLMGQPSDNSQGFKDHKHKKFERAGGEENSIKSRSLNRNGFHRSSRLDSDRYKSDATQLLVSLESDLYNDILQGNFDDSPLNQTSKHIMGYSWILEECDAKPTFVLKTEDNVFVEMYHLLNFLTAVYGENPSPSIVCDVIPAGTSPHKTQDQEILQELDKDKNHIYPKDLFET